MGLDMYLSLIPKVDSVEELRNLEKKLTLAYFEGDFEKELNKFKKEKNFIYDISIELCDYINKDNYKEVIEEGGSKIDLGIRIGYWRKFNALHAWFVNNIQSGEDDCGTYIVTERHLQLLDMELKSITKENAGEILPTQEGFFFGGTEYDDDYFDEIEDLKALVRYVLTQVNHRERTLVYRSSW